MSAPPSNGPGQPPGALPFAVTAPPELRLADNRTATTTFTVTNLTGRPVRARLLPRGRNGAADSWMSISGPTEVPLGVAGTVAVPVTVSVPPTAPEGQHLLVLEVVAEDDTETVSGQAVAFTVPARSPAPVRRRRNWLKVVLIIVGSLLALIGLLVVILVVALIVAN